MGIIGYVHSLVERMRGLEEIDTDPRIMPTMEGLVRNTKRDLDTYITRTAKYSDDLKEILDDISNSDRLKIGTSLVTLPTAVWTAAHSMSNDSTLSGISSAVTGGIFTVTTYQLLKDRGVNSRFRKNDYDRDRAIDELRDAFDKRVSIEFEEDDSFVFEEDVDHPRRPVDRMKDYLHEVDQLNGGHNFDEITRRRVFYQMAVRGKVFLRGEDSGELRKMADWEDEEREAFMEEFGKVMNRRLDDFHLSD